MGKIRKESENSIYIDEYAISVECYGKQANLVLSKVDDFIVVKNENGELDLYNTKNKRSKRSICRCSVCKKYFLRNYMQGSHVIQCISQKDDLTKEFYKSDFGKLNINYCVVERCSVKEMIEKIKSGEYNGTAGVWALWYRNECIQVAKSQNIGNEIIKDFTGGKGRLDYSQYKDGEIEIVDTKNSSFEIEAKYAIDKKALKWGIYRGNDKGGKLNEWCRIKELLDTHYWD